MLRPAQSFAKRWTWIKSCIAELVSPPAPNISPTQLIQKQSFNNQAATAFVHNDALLHTLQARFPIVNVFAPPALRPAFHFAPSFLRAPTSSVRGLRPHSVSQFRTIVTNPASFGHQTTTQAQRCLSQYQYPAFARNFSTVKPTLFQPATANAQSNVFVNLAAKPFSAINQKSGCLTQNQCHPEPVSLKIGRLGNDESSSRSSSESHNGKCGLKLISTDQTTGLYASCTEPITHQCDASVYGTATCARRARLVRRGSKRSSSDCSRTSISRNFVITAADLALTEVENGKNRYLSPADMIAAGASKTEPPDRAMKKEKQVYITVNLDASTLLDFLDLDDGFSRFTSLKRPRAPTQLTPLFLESLADLADQRRRHFSAVLSLLRTLSRKGTFEIDIEGSQIRICLENFDSIVAAREWLKSIGIDTEAGYFGLELNEPIKREEDDFDFTTISPDIIQGPSPVLLNAAYNNFNKSISASPSAISSGFTSLASSPENSIVLIPSPILSPVSVPKSTPGPEYFKQIHEFLDEVEDLVKSKPSFKSDKEGPKFSIGRS